MKNQTAISSPTTPAACRARHAAKMDAKAAEAIPAAKVVRKRRRPKRPAHRPFRPCVVGGEPYESAKAAAIAIGSTQWKVRWRIKIGVEGYRWAGKREARKAG